MRAFISERRSREAAQMVMGRIRVLVAGDIYVNPSLVRTFLADDGYEVVSDGLARADVLPAVSRLQPDAVVIDDRLLSGRRNAKLLQNVRRAAPDAKVVLVTAGTERAPVPAGVDASVQQGTSLAALSVVLGRLFAEDGSHVAMAAAGATPATTRSDSRGGATRFVVAVGAPLLVVWVLIAMLSTDGAPPPPADTTDLSDQPVILPQGGDPLDDAKAVLDRLVEAIEHGNYVFARIYARELMDERDTARSRGFLTFPLDADIRSALTKVVSSLPDGVMSSLQATLGNLFPVLEREQTTGGGSGIILGPGAGTSTGDGADVSRGGDGGTTDGGGGGGDGEGDGDGGTVVGLGPGDGRAWGQSHKQTKGDGGPPPWANGNAGEIHGHRGDPPGHHAGHGNGRGNGLGHGVSADA
jgi:CheY-like chemotaxis protein